MTDVNSIIADWPSESQEAAQLVLDKYGQPDEACESILIWHNPGPWKRIIAYKEFNDHQFPAPHIDSVESFLDYGVPPEKFTELAEFDGSVVANRTRGELSARCHDEEANFLALNLANDIVIGAKTVQEARDYYAKEFLDYRKKVPTPYMENLKFVPSGSADADERLLSDDELQAAKETGQNNP